ncbi:MAG: fumarylacetoacetate hydrolase family protein [Geminicoccaceae bacterium]
MDERLEPAQALPVDAESAVLVGRVWLPEADGPAVVAVRGGKLHDLTALAPTMSELCNAPDPVALARTSGAPVIGDVAAILANSRYDRRDRALPWLLAPIDLQACKAAGVTFVRSMLERVVEERARGDAAKSEAIRTDLVRLVGGDLRAIVPGSEAAARVKAHLIEQGAWSQYLEVGIGPDAEIFTKAQPMSSVGTGAEIGIHPGSRWNNPEPEVVLVVNAAGSVVGATLGNDVNLRDFEGRSALLLGKAKDNNASSAVGPFIRLFADGFRIDDVRRAELTMTVEGTDGFTLKGASSMAEISRDPLDLVAQGSGKNHQYPDGFVLYCGTMFAPVEDRDAPGQGFTHHLGDTVTIASPKLGTLVNRVAQTDQVEPWTFGAMALMRNLAARGLLAART